MPNGVARADFSVLPRVLKAVAGHLQLELQSDGFEQAKVEVYSGRGLQVGSAGDTRRRQQARGINVDVYWGHWKFAAQQSDNRGLGLEVEYPSATVEAMLALGVVAESAEDEPEYLAVQRPTAALMYFVQFGGFWLTIPGIQRIKSQESRCNAHFSFEQENQRTARMTITVPVLLDLEGMNPAINDPGLREVNIGIVPRVGGAYKDEYTTISQTRE